MTTNQLPVAVIGAGPVGLAAAAHLHARGIEPLIFEAGDAVGASVREWGHVRVFSPWEYNMDPVAAELLAAHGLVGAAGRRLSDRRRDRRALPRAAGRSARDRREPAPAARAWSSVTRLGIDKLKDDGRDDAPFELVVDQDGEERRYLAAR